MSFLLWASVWLIGSATAQTFYIESAPASTREPALEVARVAATEGVDGRVVRLYVEGMGWRYVFRSEEELKEEDLRADLGAIRASCGVDVHLVRFEAGKSQVIDTPVAGTKVAVPLDRTLEAQEILRRIVRAHAGPSPADRLDAADAIVFRFERTLEDRRVSHLYARRGEDVYLQVEVLSGKGTGARLGVVGRSAWMEGAEEDPLDVLRVREQVERFAPERVLSMPMSFAGGLPGGRELELMTVGGSSELEGRQVVDLVWDGDRQTSPMRLVVDVATWRLVEVAWGTDADRVRWKFLDYADLGDGAIYPSRVEVIRGADRIDQVTVSELDLEPTLLPEWFPPP